MERPWLLLNRVLHVHGNDDLHADAEEHGVVVDAVAYAHWLWENADDHVEGAADVQVLDGGVGDAEDHVDDADAGVGDAEDHVEAAGAQLQAAQNAAVAAAEEGAHEHGAGGEDQGEEDEHAGAEEDDVADEEDDVAAEDAAAAAAAAQAQQQLEQSVIDTNTNIQASEQAHADMHALGAESDFTVTVAAPPLVSSIATGPLALAHPNPESPDMFPYIVAAGRFCLLVHFSVEPYYGTTFGQEPNHSHLVMVRHFLRHGVPIAGCAEDIPDRYFAVLNIESVGLVCNQGTGHFQIAELIATRGAARALVAYFETATNNWEVYQIDNPLLTTVYPNREWVPHGTVTIDSTVLWYDLSWGLISCDLALPAPERVLDFHRLPHGRVLDAGAGVPDLHCRRCVAVSENLVRYVQIIPSPNDDDPAATTVNMWYRDLEENQPQWRMNYRVSFADIWGDHSYEQTELPRTIPMLVGVSPVDSSVVYFSLNQQLLGVNVPEHTLVHFEEYDPLNRPGPDDEPVTSRYFIPWNLGADEAPNVGHQPDNPSDHGDSSDGGPADAGELDFQAPPE